MLKRGLCFWTVCLIAFFIFGTAFAQERPDLTDNDRNGIPDVYDTVLRQVAGRPVQGSAVATTAGIQSVSVPVNTRVNTMPDQERWSGETFPIWGNVKGGISPYTYQWNFGDGSPMASGTVTDPRYIAENHAYILPVGVTRQFYTATLKVTDSSSVSDTDSVKIDVIERGVNPLANDPIEIRDLEVNMAIQDGLRWLYLQQESDGSWAPGVNRDDVGVTAEVCLAYEVQGHFPTNNYNERWTDLSRHGNLI